jgi:hypothetical protein
LEIYILIVIAVVALIVIIPIIFKGLEDVKPGSDIHKNKGVHKPEISSNFFGIHINKIKKFAQRRIRKSLLTGCSWVLTNDENDDILFTFQNNGELLITTNGNVKFGTYKLIVDQDSLLIGDGDTMEHFNVLLIKDKYLFLNKISSTEVLGFANYTKYKDVKRKSLKNQMVKFLGN